MDFELQTRWVIQKQNVQLNPLKKRLGWMCMKKSFGKYRNSEQQFSTCSAVSCIYWTFDVIISSAVFFHNVCECTCPNSTPEYGKKCKSCSSDLISYVEEEKNIYLNRSVGIVHGGERSGNQRMSWRAFILRSKHCLHSFDPKSKFRTKKPEPTPDRPPVGSVIPGVTTRACTHTHIHTCHRDQPTPADRMGRQDPAAGMRGKGKGLC